MRELRPIALLTLCLLTVWPASSLAMECRARTTLDRYADINDVGEVSAIASASQPLPTRKVGRAEVGSFGIRCYSLCDNVASLPVNPAVPITKGTLTLDEVVFTSAGTDPVAVSLNLDFDGYFKLLDVTGNYALCTVYITASIDGTTFDGEIHVCTMYCTQVWVGLLDGQSGRVYPDQRLTTPVVMVPVNQPVTVRLSMDVKIVVDKTPPARAEAFFDNTYSFAHTGPVFNVPAGVNVQSEHGVIVDNFYAGGNTVPVEPTSWGGVKWLYR